MRRWLVAGLLATSVAILLWVATAAPLDWRRTQVDTDSARALVDDADELARSLAALDLAVSPRASPALDRFRAFYGYDPGGHPHWLGALEVDGVRLAVQVVRPRDARGTAFVVHGLFDHVATHYGVIAHLVARGHAVIAVDLPGHGLSAGPRARIDDFADYQSMLDAVIAAADGRLPRPWIAIGHSTGASVLVEHLLVRESPAFDATVLVAPLVRSARWHLSVVLTSLLAPFVDSLPRRFAGDEEPDLFLRALATDPLQGRDFSLAWFEALRTWNERLDGLPARDTDAVLIVQGDADEVVDWRHNLDALRAKLPNARVVQIPGARHHLLYERPPLRAQVYRAMQAFLGDPVVRRRRRSCPACGAGSRSRRGVRAAGFRRHRWSC